MAWLASESTGKVAARLGGTSKDFIVIEVGVGRVGLDGLDEALALVADLKVCIAQLRVINSESAQQVAA